MILTPGSRRTRRRPLHMNTLRLHDVVGHSTWLFLNAHTSGIVSKHNHGAQHVFCSRFR